MPSRQSEYAVRERLKLIYQLGGICVRCGEDDIDKLEIDHIKGRDWLLRAYSSSARVARYKREAAEKKLQVLCGICNRAKRFDTGETNPESVDPADIFNPEACAA